jgi:hypothetical protein
MNEVVAGMVGIATGISRLGRGLEDGGAIGVFRYLTPKFRPTGRNLAAVAKFVLTSVQLAPARQDKKEREA